jgi:hypothetical protein
MAVEAGTVEQEAETAAAASAPAATTAMVEDDAMTFDEEWREPMMRGRKTCEARLYRYNRRTFWAFGDEYIVAKSERLKLGDIAEKWFKEHGCYSSRDFREVWKQAHGAPFDPEQRVWLHHFKKAFEAPVVEDEDEPAE